MTFRFTPLAHWCFWVWLGPRSNGVKRKTLDIFEARWAFQIGCLSVWAHL